LDYAGTISGPGSWAAATVAAGTSICATDFVLNGNGDIAYALVRPPGHHAQPRLADGSCLFNNIGIAAQHALARGVKKIAVIDWDIHHGNGTQEGFYDDDRVFTISLHMPHGGWGTNHAQTGKIDEVGVGKGIGYNFNIPLPYGAGDACYEKVISKLVTPVIDEYEPELIFIACGFDANQFDPNGRNLLTMRGFHSLAGRARELTEKHSNGKVVLFQEGGYARTYTAFCAHATFEGMLGRESSIVDPVAYYDQQDSTTIEDMSSMLEEWCQLVEEQKGNAK
jgi:acetoin utilization deacetylase AcuC-like enzyme